MKPTFFDADIVGIAQTLARVRGGNNPSLTDLVQALRDTGTLIPMTELDHQAALAELQRRYQMKVEAL
jgi:hypothetical protein